MLRLGAARCPMVGLVRPGNHHNGAGNRPDAFRFGLDAVRSVPFPTVGHPIIGIMGDPEPQQRRRSDVLEAIFEQVSDKPERTASANTLFRSSALAQLDVATEIDNQLPLVSRRNWLLLVGVAVLLAAFAVWAALTPSVTSVIAGGRVVAPDGVLPVVASEAGILAGQPLPAGTAVRPGQSVATITTKSGPSAVTATQPGTVWQVLVAPGAAVPAGAVVVTLLPPASNRAVLLAVPEGRATEIAVGMPVRVMAGNAVSGRVDSISAPLPGPEAAARTGLPLASAQGVVLVAVVLDSDLAAGMGVSGQVILSEGTVLDRLRGRS